MKEKKLKELIQKINYYQKYYLLWIIGGICTFVLPSLLFLLIAETTSGLILFLWIGGISLGLSLLYKGIAQWNELKYLKKQRIELEESSIGNIFFKK